MSRRDEWLAELDTWLAEWAPGALLADGFEDAIVGVAVRCSQPPLVVYDTERCLQILQRGGMTEDEAVDYFGFNVANAWLGPGTPLFLTRIPDDKEAT
jgi:hypothetical protein